VCVCVWTPEPAIAALFAAFRTPLSVIHWQRKCVYISLKVVRRYIFSINPHHQKQDVRRTQLACDINGIKVSQQAGQVGLIAPDSMAIDNTFRCRVQTKARFPLPELTARVNGPSRWVTGFHYLSTRPVNSASGNARPSTRPVLTGNGNTSTLTN